MSKSFLQVAEAEQSALMIVDCLNMAFRFREQDSYLDKYVDMVESLKKSYKCSKVILTCDSGSSNYRKTIYPEYKQNRKDKFDQQSLEEQLAFERFFTEFNRVMNHFASNTKYPLFRFEKCEADDVAAYIVKHYNKNFDKIVLVSSDRDWDLLIKPNVMRFSYVTRKEVTWENWNTHYDYTPDDHISIKCLVGDSGDNIRGVPGIGPKKALALVAEYGTTYDIIANIPIPSRYKYIQNLNEFGAPALMLNYQLMDLLEFCDEALGPTNCETINTTLEKYVHAN
jgi:DNA polymerase-1